MRFMRMARLVESLQVVKATLSKSDFDADFSTGLTSI
jgi:hypothetical protein